MRIGLVGCTKSKLNHAAPAKDLYMPSTLFAGRRRYVERSCDRWFILSAKHGLVDPDDVLEPYDQTLNGASRSVKREWTRLVLSEIDKAIEIDRTHFEMHAGNDYWGFGLVEGLEKRGATVTLPTTGMRIGAQLAFYAKAGPRDRQRSPPP